MKQDLHCNITGPGSPEKLDCQGTVRRNGWATVGIDFSTWLCPAWKCDKCGLQWWSYFDTDTGDEAYDMDEEDEEYYMDEEDEE